MTPEHFTTKRLTVRDWRATLHDPSRRAALIDGLGAILTPAVLAPLPETMHIGKADDPAERSRWVDAQRAQAIVYEIIETGTGTLIGLLLLGDAGKDGRGGVFHLGCLLGETAWGKGYASEMLVGLVRSLPRGTRLVAGVDPDNRASLRVLQKAGFHRIEGASDSGNDVYGRSA